MRTIYRSIWIPSAIAILGMTVLFAIHPMDVARPSAAKVYSAYDRSIRIEHPGNWRVKERSSHGVDADISFEPFHNVKMIVSLNLQSSLMTDIMRSQNAQVSQLASAIPGAQGLAGQQVSPLISIHSAQGAAMKADTEQYPDVKDGATEHTTINGKDALVTSCRWKARGVFGSIPIIGRRATILSSDHNASVIYGCPIELQKTILPEFDRMLNSLELDLQGGGR